MFKWLRGWFGNSVENEPPLIPTMLPKRYAEVYSEDRKVRLVILQRDDSLFQLYQEEVRDYSGGDELNVAIIPFPDVEPSIDISDIYGIPLDGIYGSMDDAEREAKLRLYSNIRP